MYELARDYAVMFAFVFFCGMSLCWAYGKFSIGNLFVFALAAIAIPFFYLNFNGVSKIFLPWALFLGVCQSVLSNDSNLLHKRWYDLKVR